MHNITLSVKVASQTDLKTLDWLAVSLTCSEIRLLISFTQETEVLAQLRPERPQINICHISY